MALINLATMLDPRFHTRYMVPEEIQVIKARAVCEMESCQPEPELVESETRPQASGSAEDTPGPSDAKRPKKTLGSFFKRAAATDTPGGVGGLSREIIQAELNSYLRCPPADSENDPLTWWKVHKVNFPQVSHLAKKYLCIQANSAASERLFSTGGNIVTCHRPALKPASVNRLVFLAKNLKL